MKTKKSWLKSAKNAPSFLARKMFLVVCLLVVGLLASCQNSPYPYQSYAQPYVQQQWYRSTPVYQQAPAPHPIVCGPSQRTSSEVNKALRKLNSQVKALGQPQKSKRLPKPQSTRVDPPLPTSGYTARLDKTLYPSMDYKPFYRVLSPTERWSLSEKSFWRWYGDARRYVVIRIFDPYDPKAPSSRR